MSLTGTAEGVSAKEKLIVALDVATAGEARRLFDALRDSAGMFKVGSQLFTSAGPEFVREIVGAGARGLIAVTVLTSVDASALAETGVEAGAVEAQVRRLARLADASGCDGVVASPHEIAPVRDSVARAGFLVVTPGVRPAAAAHDDQKRVMSPAGAIRAGADFIVVGRAILNSPDPARAASEVVREMEEA